MWSRAASCSTRTTATGYSPSAASAGHRRGERDARLPAVARPPAFRSGERSADAIGGLRSAGADLAVAQEVRGKGLMFAVDLVDPGTGEPSQLLAGRVLEAARERGLLIGKGGLYGHTLRMAPPMTLTEDEAREGLALLINALQAVNKEAVR